jgi:Tfp pilus assembly protein PilF
MDSTPMDRAAPARDRWQALLLCCTVIVAAVVAAYCRSFGGPFLYDDVDSIPGNVSIRSLATSFSPPVQATVGGRPVLNLSFAVNHALSGTQVWSYHALNLAIHIAAALLLLVIVRRTLATPAAGGRADPECIAVGFAAALLWGLHPLQAESVAYMVQRAESLMGLFYLLTLYAFIRLAAEGGARAWAVVSVVSCLLGMGTKEVAATAPVVVLLYDRTFVAGTFRGAWNARKALYVSYAACWLPLAYLVIQAGGRGGSAGFDSGVPWWAYMLTQFKAVALYLKLALWPHPLVGDYGRILEGHPVTIFLCALLVLSLVAAAWLLLRRRSPLGFLGAWFLIILAPSSSVIPVSTEIMAGHRMYLSLAAVVVLGVLALNAWVGRRVFLTLVALIAVGLAILTTRRIRVYGSGYAFWSDVVLKVPGNAGAWNNLGIIQAEKGDQEGAMRDYLRALDIAPKYAYAHYDLGKSLAATGHPEAAVEQYEDALQYRPEDPSIHYNLGNALVLEKRDLAAAAEFRTTLRLDPGRADAWFNLGDVMEGAGNLAEASAAYSHAVQLRPDFADARVNLGNVLAQQGKLQEAVQEFREALRLEPGAADVHNNLGSLLAENGRLEEARAEFEEAVRLKPDYPDAEANLGRVRAMEAQSHP